jgi:hypothetical protein
MIGMLASCCIACNQQIPITSLGQLLHNSWGEEKSEVVENLKKFGLKVSRFNSITDGALFGVPFDDLTLTFDKAQKLEGYVAFCSKARFDTLRIAFAIDSINDLMGGSGERFVLSNSTLRNSWRSSDGSGSAQIRETVRSVLIIGSIHELKTKIATR